MENKKRVIVCSKNAAKNQAVQNVMKDFFEEVELLSLETKSGVAETPMGDEEGILGCYNRIKDALSQEKSGDLYVAMEGILSPTSYGTFLCGWTVIYDQGCQDYYYGCSAKIKIPDEIIKRVNKTQRLSDVVAKFVEKAEEDIRKLGTNGLLTHGAYTRTDEFTDSVLCAISSKYEKRSNK